MSVAFYRSWTFLVLAAVAALANGQRANSRSAPASPASNTPFTAEFRITRVQVLANGITISRETKEVITRDAEGRSMRATTVLSPATDTADTSVSVFDPTSGEQITWSTLGKRAHVLKMPVGDQEHGCWSTPSGNATSRFGDVQPMAPRAPFAPGEAAPGPALMQRVQPIREDLGREDLGTDTIMGVEVEGTRTTRTIPAGQIGNDQPLVRTSESWRAPSLGLILRQITDDPQTGKTTRELVSIDQGDPSPADFQPPAGFKAVTEEMRPVACPSAP